MSDLTGAGLDDWEEASLPGAAFTASAQDSLTKNIIPRQPINELAEALEIHPHQPQSKAFLRPCPPVHDNYQSQTPRIPRRTGALESRPTPSMLRTSSDNTAFIKWQQGRPPNGQYELSSTWRLLLAHLRNPSGPAIRVATQRLDEICRTTKAYIAIPANEDATKLAIWGDNQQILQARARLELFENDIRATGTRPHDELWAKTTAFNARSEARQEKEKRLRDHNEALKLLSQELNFDFEAILIWPDGVDMAEFASKYEDSVLYEIAEKKNCKIDLRNEGTAFIQIRGHEKSDIMACYQRVQNLVRDSMAHEDRLIVLNQLRFPTASVYRDRVGLDKDPDSGWYLPMLRGRGLSRTESEEWDDLCTAMQRRSLKNIRNSIGMCIESMKATKKYVRMMVTFGDLGFSRYKAPPPGQDSHTFDEFCEMVANPLTRLRSYPLRARRGDLSDLVDKLTETKAFGEPTTNYGVHFDFHDPKKTTTLRLETHFNMGAEEKELEMYEKRWLEFKGNEDNDLLEINTYDFERLSYQIHVGAVTLRESRTLETNFASFESNLGLKASGHGIKAVPRRRALFPPGFGSLARVAEITVARFSFRETEGIFELRRQDIYDETPLKKSEMPAESIWTAAYYYPEWDNLLRDFGSLKAGEDVEWTRSVETFFPKSRRTEGKAALPKGFRTFMKEVEDIQDLLTGAVADLSVLEPNGRQSESPEV